MEETFPSSIYALPDISGSVRPCFYINNYLRKFTNGVCQKRLDPPTLKNNREPWLNRWLVREIMLVLMCGMRKIISLWVLWICSVVFSTSLAFCFDCSSDTEFIVRNLSFSLYEIDCFYETSSTKLCLIPLRKFFYGIFRTKPLFWLSCERVLRKLVYRESIKVLPVCLGEEPFKDRYKAFFLECVGWESLLELDLEKSLEHWVLKRYQNRKFTLMDWKSHALQQKMILKGTEA
jgi:hypothetical protein